MSSSEKEILSKLKEKESVFSLPEGILEQIYNEERLHPGLNYQSAANYENLCA